MVRSFWFTAIWSTAFCALAACSGSGGGAPPVSAVPGNAESPTSLPFVRRPTAELREKLLLAPAVDRAARFAATSAVLRTLSSTNVHPGCTPIMNPASPANGLTAKLILNHSASGLTVDGTGCDLAIYVPPGTNLTILNSHVGGAGTAQIAADKNVHMDVLDSQINAGQQTVGIYFLQNGSGSVCRTNIDVLAPAPSNALPITKSVGPAGIVGPSTGNLTVLSVRIDMAQNATGIIALGNTLISELQVKSHFIAAYGASQFLSPGVFTVGTSQIKNSTFDDVTTDGFGIGMTFENGGSGVSSHTVVHADFVGHAVIFAGDVTVDGSQVTMPLPTPPFATFGVRVICQNAPCTNHVSIRNVVELGNGYHDPTTPDFANDSIGFQFSQPTQFVDNLAQQNSVAYYSCNVPNINTIAQLKALLTATGNKAVGSTNADFFVSHTFNDCQ